MVNYWAVKITKGGKIPFDIRVIRGGKIILEKKGTSEVKEGYEKYVSRRYAQSFAEEYRKHGIECEVIPLNEVSGKEKFNNVKKQNL